MTDGTATLRSRDGVAAFRAVLAVVGGVVFVACLVPPLATAARRFEFAEGLQFSLLAVAVPALIACGAPWRHLRLAAPAPAEVGEDGALIAPAGLGPVDRLALGRRRHPEPLRAVAFAGTFLVVAVLWRIPPTVDALAHHPVLVVVEAVTLVVAGLGLWLELVESPPLTPRLPRPHRVAMAAVVMWVIWVVAYLVGLSHGAWYHGYDHTAAHGISISADQQLTTGIIWALTGIAFVPVVFWNLVRWLQAEEDPDDELYRLIRQERIRGRPADHGSA